jgi:hypothetical protein
VEASTFFPSSLLVGLPIEEAATAVDEAVETAAFGSFCLGSDVTVGFATAADCCGICGDNDRYFWWAV